ncbi:MAG: tetratricopeptide repeat protein [Rhodospirillales bacterium]
MTRSTGQPSPSIDLRVPIAPEEAIYLAVWRAIRAAAWTKSSRSIATCSGGAAAPGCPALHGRARHQRGDAAAAIELIRQAIAIAPAHADAHNNLGNVLRETGRPEEARDAYERRSNSTPRTSRR